MKENPDGSERAPGRSGALCNVRFGSKADISISRLIAVFTLQLLPMWRSAGEQNRQVAEVHAVSLLERSLTDVVLLNVVIAAEAD